MSLPNRLPDLLAQAEQSKPSMTWIFLAGHHLLCLTKRDPTGLLNGTGRTDPQKLHPLPQGNRVVTNFLCPFILISSPLTHMKSQVALIRSEVP